MQKIKSFSTRNEYKILSVILVLIFLFRMFELSKVGETWDEYPKVRNGQLHIKSITSGDFSYSAWEEHKKHPPLAKIILAMPTYIEKSLKIEIFNNFIYNEGKRYELSRITSLIFSIGTLFLTYLCTKKLFDKSSAIFAIIFLTLMPHFVAHSYIATIESIQAFFTMLFFYKLASSAELSAKTGSILGILLGLLLLTKLTSLLLILYPIFFVTIYYRSKEFITKFKFILIIYILATCIFYIGWPWLWSSPINRLLESFNSITREPRQEIFLGQYNLLPWYYFIYYFIISTPIIYLIIFSAGLAKLFWHQNNFGKNLLIALVCFLSIFLLSFSGFKQNGVRYMYLSFPIFAIIVGNFSSKMINSLRNIELKISYTFIVLALAVLANFKISPYYLDYYNEFTGGVRGAYKNKLAQVEWWGEGTKEAVIWMNDNLPKNSRVCVNIIPHHVVPQFREDIKVDKDCIYDKDYLFYNRMFQLQERFNVEAKHTKIYETKIDGAILNEVYKVKKDN